MVQNIRKAMNEPIEILEELSKELEIYNQKKKAKSKNFIFQIHETLHAQLKIAAEEKNITMKNYVLQAVFEKMVREGKYK